MTKEMQIVIGVIMAFLIVAALDILKSIYEERCLKRQIGHSITSSNFSFIDMDTKCSKCIFWDCPKRTYDYVTDIIDKRLNECGYCAFEDEP